MVKVKSTVVYEGVVYTPEGDDLPEAVAKALEGHAALAVEGAAGMGANEQRNPMAEPQATVVVTGDAVTTTEEAQEGQESSEGADEVPNGDATGPQEIEGQDDATVVATEDAVVTEAPADAEAQPRPRGNQRNR